MQVSRLSSTYFPLGHSLQTAELLQCHTNAALTDNSYHRGPEGRELKSLESVRHPFVIRLTHWITACSFLGLLIGGIAILLAHPRLYWGETGALGAPSLVDLPLPLVLEGQSGWGRNLHFVSAWFCTLSGLLYVAYGLLSRHFYRSLLPTRSDLSFRVIAEVVSNHLRLRPSGKEESESFRYHVLQRFAYLSVVFVLFPLIIATGLAMSPTLTSVFPSLVRSFGGHQSARTIHFLIAMLLVVFLAIHIAMVCLAGFVERVRLMIVGHSGPDGSKS